MMEKATLLIVDDRPENLLALEQLLSSDDIEIVRALSGLEALEKTLDHQFALILLDVQMPDMDGYETAKLLRGNKRTSAIPIIFVTAALKDQDHVFRGYGSGAVDYLLKPLEPSVLQSKVKIFLELHRQRQLLEVKTKELDAKVAELEALQHELKASNEKLRLLSSRDGLTDLPNRRFFDETLEREWKRGLRDQTPVCLILADIDHFKAYNDSYGHVMGDDCLKQVGQRLASAPLRDVDTMARYGGEEFAVILPDTDISGGELIARRMLDFVSELNIEHNQSPTASHVTVSLGLNALVPSVTATPTALVASADKALYRAKASGRNRFCV